jgi:hypothetical protein
MLKLVVKVSTKLSFGRVDAVSANHGDRMSRSRACVRENHGAVMAIAQLDLTNPLRFGGATGAACVITFGRWHRGVSSLCSAKTFVLALNPV